MIRIICIFVLLVALSRPAWADLDQVTDLDIYERVFDYIVVGAGAAGCVVASRLSEDPANDVLILEAGGPSQRDTGGTDYVATYGHVGPNGVFVPDTKPLTRYDVPAMFPTTTWPDLGTLWGVGNATLSKLVGGSMIHNGMGWFRATPADIDAWNVDGWNGTSFLEYYKRSENVTGSSVEGDTTYHGHSGPLQISDNAVTPIEANIFVAACNASGQPLNPDFNGASRLGCGYIVHNIKRGVRASTAVAYLVPALPRRNLELRMYSQATRVLFSQNAQTSEWKAVGVEYYHNGKFRKVYAKKEVILSGGSINTAKLLMLSGIGPQSTLQQFNIPVRMDSPNVGKGIRNHLLLFTSWANPNANPPNMYNIGTETMQYARFGTGILATAASFAGAYLNTIDSSSQSSDVHIFVNPRGNKTVGFTLGTSKATYANGEVNLVSADPLVDPHLSANLLSSQNDVDTLVRALKALRNIMSFAPANTSFGPEITPGPAYQNDTQLEQWVRTNINKHDHWYGSARMGNDNDPDAVVDPRMRVRGVKRLRVVDASVIPGPVDCLMMAPVVALAEKGAEMIKQDN